MYHANKLESGDFSMPSGAAAFGMHDGEHNGQHMCMMAGTWVSSSGACPDLHRTDLQVADYS